jgi:hypothetical protein
MFQERFNCVRFGSEADFVKQMLSHVDGPDGRACPRYREDMTVGAGCYGLSITG